MAHALLMSHQHRQARMCDYIFRGATENQLTKAGVRICAFDKEVSAKIVRLGKDRCANRSALWLDNFRGRRDTTAAKICTYIFAGRSRDRATLHVKNGHRRRLGENGHA